MNTNLILGAIFCMLAVLIAKIDVSNDNCSAAEVTVTEIDSFWRGELQHVLDDETLTEKSKLLKAFYMGQDNMNSQMSQEAVETIKLLECYRDACDDKKCRKCIFQDIQE